MAVVRSITGLDLEAFGRRRHGRALEIVSVRRSWIGFNVCGTHQLGGSTFVMVGTAPA